MGSSSLCVVKTKEQVERNTEFTFWTFKFTAQLIKVAGAPNFQLFSLMYCPFLNALSQKEEIEIICKCEDVSESKLFSVKRARVILKSRHDDMLDEFFVAKL